MSAGGAGAPALLPSFYAGREVFVTGGTGFIGKTLLERILWTCPKVSRVHVLVRQKRGQTPQQRLELLTQSQIFDNIRAECPTQLQKLNLVSGDVGEPQLGMDVNGVEQLQHVSVVFHVAASVKLMDALPELLKHNVNGVEAICDLCDQLPLLESLVYVSTAYCLSDRHHVPEEVLPSPLSLTRVRAIVEALPHDILEEITPRLIAPKTNNYVFTKCLAENFLLQRPHRHYSIGICRPTIVVSSCRWPYPGWIQGLSGPCGPSVGIGLGLLHVAMLDMDKRSDFIPVDIVVDTILAIAWENATDRPSEIRVYNCSSQQNPLTWGQFESYSNQAGYKHPFSEMIYYPFYICVKNRYVFGVLDLLLHTMPLFTASQLAILCGVKTKIDFQVVNERKHLMFSVLSHFMTNEWDFATDNFQRLRDRLSQADTEIYNLNVTTINWEKHTGDFVLGIRRHVLQDPDESLPKARKKLARLRWIHYGVMFVLCVMLYQLVTLLMVLFQV